MQPLLAFTHLSVTSQAGPIALCDGMDHRSQSHRAVRAKVMSPETSYSSESEQKADAGQYKRRPSRAGTRSVSTLTPAQLERKRANDREAQRAIRQRTKDHVEGLERKIAELSSKDSNQRLVKALQRVETLEQENTILRARLGGPSGVYTPGDEAVLGDRSLAGPSRHSPVSRLGQLAGTRLPTTVAPTPRLQGIHSPNSPSEAWQSPVLPNINPPSSVLPNESMQPTASANWSQGLPRLSVHQDSSTHGMQQMDHSVQTQAGHSGYGYAAIMDATTPRPTAYGSTEQVPMSYEHTQPNYGQSDYQSRTMAQDVGQTQAGSYSPYQSPQGYPSNVQQQRHAQAPQHMMYNISRPG